MISLVNLSMDKNVEDILSKSQYGQKRRLISLVNLSMDKKRIPLVNLSMDKKVILSMDKNVNLSSMDKNFDDIHSKSQHGQIRRGNPQ